MLDWIDAGRALGTGVLSAAGGWAARMTWKLTMKAGKKAMTTRAPYRHGLNEPPDAEELIEMQRLELAYLRADRDTLAARVRSLELTLREILGSDGQPLTGEDPAQASQGRATP